MPKLAAPWRHLLLALATALAIVPCASAGAAVVPRAADLEDGTFAEFDQLHQTTGTIAVDGERAYSGSRSARAHYAGGGANGYQRGIWNVGWRDGDEVWYSAAIFLPSGFKAAMQGQVDLLRWDNWASHPDDTDWGGLVMYGSDRRMRLMRFNMANTGATTLVGPFDVPEGRWVHLEVHQRLGAQDALSEVWMDGGLVGSSALPNSYGRAVERVRVGIVAIASGRQLEPLTMWFDRAALGVSPAGPLGALAAAPALAPTPAPMPATPALAPTAVPAPPPAPAPTPAPAQPGIAPKPKGSRPRRVRSSTTAARRRARHDGARRLRHRAWKLSSATLT